MTIQEYMAGYENWSADEIANILRWQGIKGVKGTCTRCPIANEVTKYCGFGYRIGGSVIEKYVPGLEVIYPKVDVEVPQGIQKFIEKFDEGKYPDLDVAKNVHR